jgi:hypothetical protein
MQGTLLKRLVALAGAALLAAAPPPPAVAATAQVSVQVPEGKTRSIRLRRLPQGAVVAVEVRASGRLRIALVSALQLKSPKPQALFRAELDRRLAFQVVIPESSDYYLVLDNRRGDKPVNATATIRATKGTANPPKPAPGKGGKFEETRAAAAAQT